MSRKIDITVSCPSCGNSEEVAVYTSVNVTLEPRLREEIFNDSVNRFMCLDCGNNFQIPVNLMYHDMARKFAVWFCPQGDMPEEEKEAFGKVAQLMGIGEYLYKAPVTHTWEEFKNLILELEKKK